MLYQFGEHLTARHAHRTLVARFGRAPALPTVRRFLTRYRREHARDLSAVANPDRHRSHRRPAGGDAAAHVERLNQLWELDSTPADVICADGRRHAIVAALDVWPRRARVLVVPTSRATAIAALLRRCILEWGVPETVRTDEGRDYTSRHLLGVLADLEIAHDPCPPYSPERKPFVERFLGTMARDLFAFLPGFIGHDVAQAQALRARKSFADRRGEDAAETFGCSLSAEALQARCDTWCDAVYGREPHARPRRAFALRARHIVGGARARGPRRARAGRIARGARRGAAGARSARAASASITSITSRARLAHWWASACPYARTPADLDRILVYLAGRQLRLRGRGPRRAPAPTVPLSPRP